MHGNDTGYGYTLLLPTGQLIWREFAKFIHADCLQAFLHTLPDLFRRNTQVLGSKADILLHDLTNNLVVRVLEHHSGGLPDIPQILLLSCIHPIYPDCSLCWKQNSIHVLGQCRFPGAIMSQNGNELPLFNVQ